MFSKKIKDLLLLFFLSTEVTRETKKKKKKKKRLSSSGRFPRNSNSSIIYPKGPKPNNKKKKRKKKVPNPKPKKQEAKTKRRDLCRFGAVGLGWVGIDEYDGVHGQADNGSVSITDATSTTEQGLDGFDEP